ncbi:MAG: hypothetical protein ABI605_09265 [Rhizobacter sp.]
MSTRNQQAFKTTQIFDWESEPTDERPTDFSGSTGFSALSGYYVAPEAHIARQRRQQRHRIGLAKLVIVSLTIMVIASAAMVQMVHLLKA